MLEYNQTIPTESWHKPPWKGLTCAYMELRVCVCWHCFPPSGLALCSNSYQEEAKEGMKSPISYQYCDQLLLSRTQSPGCVSVDTSIQSIRSVQKYKILLLS